MDNRTLYEDLSDAQRMELDWRAEQRAEARFLRDTYADGQADTRADTMRTESGHNPPNQLSLFGGDIQ